LNTETARRKRWLVNVAFAVFGYVALMFVADGQLGILEVFRLYSMGDRDAAGASLVALTLLYGSWVTRFGADKARCLCLCAACLIFIVQTALTHWHAFIVVPLIGYSLVTLYLVLTWLDTGSLE
jgi:hypothetical protein